MLPMPENDFIPSITVRCLQCIAFKCAVVRAWRGAVCGIYIYIYTVRRLEVETNAVLHCVAWRGARACVCVCECVAALLLEVE